MSVRKRILFVGEAVSLAHVTRPLVLARALDPRRYEVHFACAAGNDFLFDGVPDLQRWTITSIPSQQFLRALARGARLYELQTLEQYVEEDVGLLNRVRPDLVVGDFRLSLAVSAPVCAVPYAALANAHWSPFTTCRRFPLPEHALERVLGLRIATALFRLVQPAVFNYHARPLNQLRRRHGLPALGSLLNVYTHGDWTLYLDLPRLAPTRNAPPNHRYLGPVIWSPAVASPPWWDTLDPARPSIYATLGSSGDVDVLPALMTAVDGLPVDVMLATAGRGRDDAPPPANVFSASYLPGLECATRARLVVCSGGSATAYQALSVGCPVLGIPSNLDQYLTMSSVRQAEAGRLVRAGRASPSALRQAVADLLDNAQYREHAQRLRGEISAMDAALKFREFVAEIL